MKEVQCRLQDLPILHPRLLWETIILAGASVLEGVDRRAPYTFLILAEDIPGFGSEELILTIDPSGYHEESIIRLRRTFELRGGRARGHRRRGVGPGPFRRT